MWESAGKVRGLPPECPAVAIYFSQASSFFPARAKVITMARALRQTDPPERFRSLIVSFHRTLRGPLRGWKPSAPHDGVEYARSIPVVSGNEREKCLDGRRTVIPAPQPMVDGWR